MMKAKNLEKMKIVRPQRKRTRDRNHHLESGKRQEHPHPKNGQRRNPNVSLITLPSHSLANHYVLGGPRVEVEYEQEVESVPLTRSALANW